MNSGSHLEQPSALGHRLLFGVRDCFEKRFSCLLVTFEGRSNAGTQFKGFYLPWQILAGVAVLVFLMVMATGLVAIRGVLRLEPAEVFR